jgi:DNA-binding HxlR family transcriptional regulator
MTKEIILQKSPIKLTLELIGKYKKTLIIKELLTGTKRFSEILRKIPNIRGKQLTIFLREMEEQGLLVRKIYPQIPPRVEYTLTNTGYSLKVILEQIRQWGERYEREAKNITENTHKT